MRHQNVLYVVMRLTAAGVIAVKYFLIVHNNSVLFSVKEDVESQDSQYRKLKCEKEAIISWTKVDHKRIAITLKFGYSFMYIVIMPTNGSTPRALPTMSFFVNHSCPGAYRPRSSTELLSPLVRNLTVPLFLKSNIPHGLVIFSRQTNQYHMNMNVYNTTTCQFNYFSCSLRTLCTIGMSRPSTLKTTISPTRTGSSWKLVRNNKSPRWNAGSILPLNTTTMGDSLPVATISPFQIINADDTIIPKLRNWYKYWNKMIENGFNKWWITINSVVIGDGGVSREIGFFYVWRLRFRRNPRPSEQKKNHHWADIAIQFFYLSFVHSLDILEETTKLLW